MSYPSYDLTFNQLQDRAVSYSKRNFGDHYGTGYRNLIGVMEELGELAHAQLKGEQNIKHTQEHILLMKKDAVGDILIFLANYCDSQGLVMADCVILALKEIEKRDFVKNNITG